MAGQTMDPQFLDLSVTGVKASGLASPDVLSLSFAPEQVKCSHSSLCVSAGQIDSLPDYVLYCDEGSFVLLSSIYT